MILAISAASKESVDEIVYKALSSGGKISNDPQDHGFMYAWSFQDVDGHLWEVIYMDESAASRRPRRVPGIATRKNPLQRCSGVFCIRENVRSLDPTEPDAHALQPSALNAAEFVVN